MKPKSFDCMKTKQAAQEKIRATEAGADRQAKVEFFRTGADECERRIQAAKEATIPDGPSKRTWHPDGRSQTWGLVIRLPARPPLRPLRGEANP